MNATLEAIVAAELSRPAPAAVVAFANQLAARAGTGTAAVLFYGSALRDDVTDGVLDFYVLADPGTWPQSGMAALAQRLLPPNVGYTEMSFQGRVLRAKYAVMSPRQFRARMSSDSLDTTLWARFSQPCVCVHARSEIDAADVRSSVTAAVVTAAGWAAALGPERGGAPDFWRALFARTYSAELRVESSARGGDIVARDIERYTNILPAAWGAGGLAFSTQPDGSLQPAIDPGDRQAQLRRWHWRERMGPVLNTLRLLKAAGTFENAIDYVAWKVERHSGYRIEPSEFQRRHPLLAAPALYWRLRTRGVLR